MSAIEKELEARLDALLDANPDFTRITMCVLRRHGLIEATFNAFKDATDATADDVTTFECEYRGTIELYDEEGRRKPAGIERLAFTREMRAILADLKGKTFKSYECVMAEDRAGIRPDGMAGITLGQHAVHLFSRDFPFMVGGVRVELAALRCERKSLRDGFWLPPDVPVHSYAVGERIAGVELVTDRVKAEVGGEACGFDIDVAVAVRTAHAVYTFSRESWRSTDIRISAADDIVISYETGECDAGWLGVLPDEEIVIAKVTRKTTKLA